MKIYIKINANEIIEVEEEKQDDTFIEYDIKNLDDFNEKIKEYEYDSEIEEKIAKIFEITDEETLSLNQYNIKHWVSNRSFGELIDMYENEEIKKPEMQRKFVWDSLKCSRLIESIIMGLPIPPLFLLEIENNRYEIIDGFQRLSTLYNFINGYPWNSEQKTKRKIPSKLSNKISREIRGKTFKDLSPDYQRILKRSTIPLIEFKQLSPDNSASKYLIFERINTGSEKLSPMQIRKSLAYGNFIVSLYQETEKNELFLSLFSKANKNKDSHIEAFLRIYVMNSIYSNNYCVKKEGIKNILNDYCEKNKDLMISDKYIEKFNRILERCKLIFTKETDMFKRVEKISGDYIVVGNRNIGIMESFIATFMNENVTISNKEIFDNYQEILSRLIQKSIEFGEFNPFSTSTGTINSINSRFKICRNILGVKNDL